jgi:hypothetical protein
MHGLDIDTNAAEQHRSSVLHNAAAGPPCQECLDFLRDCLDEAVTQAESAQCFVDFRVCRVGCER